MNVPGRRWLDCFYLPPDTIATSRQDCNSPNAEDGGDGGGEVSHRLHQLDHLGCYCLLHHLTEGGEESALPVLFLWLDVTLTLNKDKLLKLASP